MHYCNPILKGGFSDSDGKTKIVSARAVLAFLNALDKSKVNMHGFLMLRNGDIAAQGYWKPYVKETPHRMFSVSKSMTSLAIGILAGDGLLKLNDPIGAYFPEYLPDPVPGPISRMTIRHMLMMATAHRSSTYKQVRDDNWTRTFFTMPPDNEPGAVFAYDTSASHTLAALVQKCTGQTLLAFLEERLFKPLGLNGTMRWLTDPVGVCQGGSGLVCTLHDLGQVAACCLRGGDGFVPEDFLRAATAKQIDTPLQPHLDEQFGYGYQFWCTRRNGYAMFGMGGQLAVCLPDHDLVVCTMADTQLDHSGVQKIHDAIFDHALPLMDDFSADADLQAELNHRLQSLCIPVVENHTAFEFWTSSIYLLEPNPMGIERIQVEKGKFAYVKDGREQLLFFGVGEMAQGVFPSTVEPCIASAGWLSPGVLHLVCHMIGDEPGVMDMLLAFCEDRVTMKVRSPHQVYLQSYNGSASGIRMCITGDGKLDGNGSR